MQHRQCLARLAHLLQRLGNIKSWLTLHVVKCRHSNQLQELTASVGSDNASNINVANVCMSMT